MLEYLTATFLYPNIIEYEFHNRNLLVEQYKDLIRQFEEGKKCNKVMICAL